MGARRDGQKVDVHPSEKRRESDGFSTSPGYDVASLAEKTSKARALSTPVSHCSNLSRPKVPGYFGGNTLPPATRGDARLPQDRQKDAFDHCWRKDWQENEAHLLPAKYLSAWIDNNVYLPLDEAPFDRSSGLTLAGALLDCPRRRIQHFTLFRCFRGSMHGL